MSEPPNTIILKLSARALTEHLRSLDDLRALLVLTLELLDLVAEHSYEARHLEDFFAEVSDRAHGHYSHFYEVAEEQRRIDLAE